jgi:hypothetical protein
MNRLLFALVLASTVALGGVGCDKMRTAATTSLDATQPLLISFDGDVAQCDTHPCLIGIVTKLRKSPTAKLEDAERAVRIYGDGSYKVFEAGEAPEKPEPEELPDNWMETPEKTPEEWDQEADEKVMGNALKELATGSLVEVDGRKVLEIAPDLLPSSDFYLATNGYFGATYNEQVLGSPTKMGATKINR